LEVYDGAEAPALTAIKAAKSIRNFSIGASPLAPKCPDNARRVA
jgi:hypothetical protein